MAQTAADILIEVLQDWGVDTVFGLPGDGINGIMEALRKRQDAIRFIQVRHEESAAFMACGYAKFTGQLGVCLATSGPGGLHLLNGLYDAKLDGQPVLAITGHAVSRSDRHPHAAGRRARQASSRTSRSTTRASWARRTSRTWRTSPAARRSPTAACAHITFPVDLQEQRDRDERSKRNVPHHTSDVLRAQRAAAARRRSAPRRRHPERRARRSRSSPGAARSARRTSSSRSPSMLGAPIVKALLGKAAVPDDSPYTTGGDRPARHAPSQEAMEDVRHAADGRHVVPVHRVPARSRGRRAACRSSSTRCASACAIRSRSGSSATAGARCRRCCRCCSATTTARFLEKAQAGHAGVVGADGGARHARRTCR